jgi:hypothetical protein
MIKKLFGASGPARRPFGEYDKAGLAVGEASADDGNRIIAQGRRLFILGEQPKGIRIQLFADNAASAVGAP